MGSHVGWGPPGWAEACAVAAWCAWAAYLCWRDFRFRRLPDHATLPAAVVLAAVSLYDGSFPAFLIGAAVWSGTYLAVGVVTPSAVGGGDVKLAIALGGLTAVVAGPVATMAAMVVAGLATAVAGAAVGVVSRRGPVTVPHGPSMLLGCAGVIVGGPIG